MKFQSVIFLCLLSFASTLRISAVPSSPVDGKHEGVLASEGPSNPGQVPAHQQLVGDKATKVQPGHDELSSKATPQAPSADASPQPQTTSPQATLTNATKTGSVKPEENDTTTTKAGTSTNPAPITTTTSATTAPTVPTSTNNTPSPATNKTTTPSPVTTPSTKPTVTTTASPTTPHAQGSTTTKPVETRKFDGASFIGGMILSLGMLAIGFIGFKYYKTQSERNYHTL